MKLSIISISSFAFFSCTTALPTEATISKSYPGRSYAHTIRGPGSTCSSSSFESDDGQVVTLEIATKYLKDNMPKVANHNVFYNGAGVDASMATKFAKSVGGNSYNTIWNEYGSKAFDRQCNWSQHVTTKELQEYLSGAMAAVSKGVAYLYTTDGTVLDSNNIWTRIEYPQLKKNGVKVCVVAAGTNPRQAQWYKGETTIKITAKDDECK
ncbi:hypothetical protein N0V93_005497 [Gnomoniopsis smithogilvyi]|uniref:Uncharacterized protein n=1 Tax=Gnomoniopsis smithogilvyi TaxID=1191159 RepID=A0A9W9CWS9_9PEZI|nr:hypothetical protein N0V93_005497 [Gnomoniopsis smithogilvyi]